MVMLKGQAEYCIVTRPLFLRLPTLRENTNVTLDWIMDWIIDSILDLILDWKVLCMN